MDHCRVYWVVTPAVATGPDVGALFEQINIPLGAW